MIVVTGASGFIGCNLVRKLNSLGHSDLILVDHFDEERKADNLAGCAFHEKINRDTFLEWFTENTDEVDFVFHLGARTDTTEFNFRVLDSLNLSYSKALWEICTVKQIPMLYASSAATYGLGEKGFDDDQLNIPNLKPLNPYGVSKQLFDLFVLQQIEQPPFWVGLKFFNVYGPHEYHKGRMASVVLHAYNQIKATGELKLFQSHNAHYKDGEQLRDFIYVDDVVDVCLFFYNAFSSTGGSQLDGIYNLGTGHARSFNDLGRVVFSSLGLAPKITYIPTPEDIRDKYQYFTEAKMSKLKRAGFNKEFTALEKGISDYVAFLQATNKTN